MIVRQLREAEADLYDAAARYEDDEPGLGIRFLTAVDAGVDQLRRHPESAESWPIPLRTTHSVRHLLVDGFPFYIVYVLTNDLLWIVAVAHTSQRPGYWAGRMHQVP